MSVLYYVIYFYFPSKSSDALQLWSGRGLLKETSPTISVHCSNLTAPNPVLYLAAHHLPVSALISLSLLAPASDLFMPSVKVPSHAHLRCPVSTFRWWSYSSVYAVHCFHCFFLQTPLSFTDPRILFSNFSLKFSQRICLSVASKSHKLLLPSTHISET